MRSLPHAECPELLVHYAAAEVFPPRHASHAAIVNNIEGAVVRHVSRSPTLALPMNIEGSVH